MPLVDCLEFAKNWLVPKDQSLRQLMHVHIGLAIYLIAVQLHRRGFQSPFPLLLLFLLECVNEIADMWGHWSLVWSWRWRDTLSDMASTIFWPLMLYLMALGRSRSATDDEASESRLDQQE